MQCAIAGQHDSTNACQCQSSAFCALGTHCVPSNTRSNQGVAIPIWQWLLNGPCWWPATRLIGIMPPLLAVCLHVTCNSRGWHSCCVQPFRDSDAAFHLLLGPYTPGLAARPTALLGHICWMCLSASQVVQGSLLHLIQARLRTPWEPIDVSTVNEGTIQLACPHGCRTVGERWRHKSLRRWLLGSLSLSLSLHPPFIHKAGAFASAPLSSFSLSLSRSLSLSLSLISLSLSLRERERGNERGNERERLGEKQ